MINFRHKEFSKKKIVSSTIKYVKDHPILPLSAASLGVGVANYKTNTKRQRESVEQHKAQLAALEKLNNNITENSKVLKTVNEALEKNKNSTSITAPKNEKQEKGRSFIFRKLYSIEDGGFKGRKVAPKKSSVGIGASVGAAVGAGFGFITSYPGAQSSTAAGIGAVLGAGIGALAVWLSNIAEDSIFNKGLSKGANSYTLIKWLENYYMPKEEVSEELIDEVELGNGKTRRRIIKTNPRQSTISPVGTLFNIDSDPKKCILNILLRGNVMAILVNDPTKTELKKANIVLDNYCRNYRLADYTSEKLGKNIYLVEVNIVQSTEGSLVLDFIKAGLKVNIVTSDRFGIKNR